MITDTHTQSHPFRVRQWNNYWDSKLKFEANREAVCKKGRRICLVLFPHWQNRTTMTSFYRAFIKPIVFFLLAWFGNLYLKSRNGLNQIVKWSRRLVGESGQLEQITGSFLNDDSHHVHSEFQLPPSRRAFKFRTKTYKNSFAQTEAEATLIK